jgi:hypothetical protein
MHAYLLIGKDKNNLWKEIERLSSALRAKPKPFPIVKIEDVRSLGNITKLGIDKPSVYILDDIENATTEALNAFLKNLEEPQDNLFYILTASNLSKVLPTIASRCQIIKVESKNQLVTENNGNDFFNLPIGKKFLLIDKIKSRDEALTFVNGLIYQNHSQITTSPNNFKGLCHFARVLDNTYNNLQANGNVSLHLTNMAIHTT